MKRSKDTICYREGLTALEQKRYDEKLQLLNGCDPYEETNWSDDVTLLPKISYIDIVNYLLFTPSPYTSEDLKSYKGLEAYNQFASGWVRDRQTFVCNGRHVVTAKVLHSQRLREKPLRPWVIADTDGKIEGAHCTCMAGLGEACTHIAALLFAIDATVRIRDSKTVTDQKAYWALPSSFKTVQYKRANSIDFTSAGTAKKKLIAAVEDACSDTPGKPASLTPPTKRKEDIIPLLTEEENQTFFKNISMSSSRPILLSIEPPYNDKYLPKSDSENFRKVLQDYKDEVCMEMNYKDLVEHCSKLQVTCTAEQASCIEIETREQAKSKLWHRFRAGRVTASKARAVCRTDKNNPSQSLIMSICYPESTKFSTTATRWGCTHEKEAGQKFLEVMSTFHDNCQLVDSGLVSQQSTRSLELPRMVCFPVIAVERHWLKLSVLFVLKIKE